MEAVFEVRNVIKKYQKFQLGPINLSIPEGFTTALIGSNGAGKTTLLDLIAGISLKKEGEIQYWNAGSNIDASDIREELGYVSANNYFPNNWTVKTIARSVVQAYEKFSPERFEQLCKEFRIESVKDKNKLTIGKMSDGNRMRMMLATVLARDTKVLVLDEPASPLDPVMRDDLCEQFRHYLAKGDGKRSVLLSTHNVADMEMVTDYAVLMAQGKVIEAGFVEDLKDNYRIIRGECEDYIKVKNTMLYGNQSNFGFEGLIRSDDLKCTDGIDVITERPTLQQLSVFLLKHAEADGQ